MSTTKSYSMFWIEGLQCLHQKQGILTWHISSFLLPHIPRLKQKFTYNGYPKLQWLHVPTIYPLLATPLQLALDPPHHLFQLVEGIHRPGFPSIAPRVRAWGAKRNPLAQETGIPSIPDGRSPSFHFSSCPFGPGANRRVLDSDWLVSSVLARIEDGGPQWGRLGWAICKVRLHGCFAGWNC